MAVMINRSRNLNPALDARVVISRKIPNTAIGREARDAAATLGFAVCQIAISQRVALAETIVSGQTITQYEPTSPAAAEFSELAKEIRECLKM